MVTLPTAKEVLRTEWNKHYISYPDSLLEQITLEAMYLDGP